MRPEILKNLEEIDSSVDETFAECSLIRKELMPSLRSQINEMEEQIDKLIDEKCEVETKRDEYKARVTELENDNEELVDRNKELEDQVWQFEQDNKSKEE